MQKNRTEIRLLDGSQDEMRALQSVFEDSARYFQCITGLPPGNAEAQSTFTALPPGKYYDDKFVFGIFDGAEMVGCVDLVRGFPDPSACYLGLLLVRESRQRFGFGREALKEIEHYVQAWEECRSLRVGVLCTNDSAIAFLLKHGFVPTDERKPYTYGSVCSEVVMLQRRLRE